MSGSLEASVVVHARGLVVLVVVTMLPPIVMPLVPPGAILKPVMPGLLSPSVQLTRAVLPVLVATYFTTMSAALRTPWQVSARLLGPAEWKFAPPSQETSLSRV